MISPIRKTPRFVAFNRATKRGVKKYFFNAFENDLNLADFELERSDLTQNL